MKQSIFSLLLAVVLFACADEDKQTSENPTTENTPSDSTSVDIDSTANSDLAEDITENVVEGPKLSAAGIKTEWFETTAFPYEITEENFEAEEEGIYFSENQIKALMTNYSEDEISGMSQFYLEQAIKMDSMDQAGTLDTYMDQIDIGMITHAACYPHQLLKVDDKRFYLVWILDWHTYEACPYGEGTHYFASYVENDVIRSCTQIAEFSGGGDPPVSSETTITSVLQKDGNIQIDYLSKDFEEYDNANGEVIEDSTVESRRYAGILESEPAIRAIK